jgi:uncharacterized protein (TIGR00725 family)
MSAPLESPHRVAVIGPGSCDARRAEQAETIGRLLAEAGVTLLCGGLGGVMDAAARGCTAAGGTSVGFLPHTDAATCSAWLTIPLPTGLGEARNVLVVGTAEVVIAIGGGVGTLSEMALAWKAGKPVVALESWNVDPPPGTPSPPVRRVRDPQEAVAVALDLLQPVSDASRRTDGRETP